MLLKEVVKYQVDTFKIHIIDFITDIHTTGSISSRIKRVWWSFVTVFQVKRVPSLFFYGMLQTRRVDATCRWQDEGG